MGHIHFQQLPDLPRWRDLTELIADGGTVAEIAAATLQAAERGYLLAMFDPGVFDVVSWLSQLTLAAREDGFLAALDRIGISCPETPELFDITSGFCEALDAHFREQGRRSDIAEMAQMAAVESLIRKLSQGAPDLFSGTSPDVQQTLAEFSTRNGFAALAQEFFGRFTHRFLAYHLGRELSDHVGINLRFPDPDAHTQFVADLGDHCRDTASVVAALARQWYANANFVDGLSPTKVRNFVRSSLQHMQDELQIRGAGVA